MGLPCLSVLVLNVLAFHIIPTSVQNATGVINSVHIFLPVQMIPMGPDDYGIRFIIMS